MDFLTKRSKLEWVIIFVLICLFVTLVLRALNRTERSVRIISVEYLYSSLNEATIFAHTKSILKSRHPDQELHEDGEVVRMINYSPAASVDGIVSALRTRSLSLAKFKLVQKKQTLYFEITDAEQASNCYVSYQQAQDHRRLPVIKKDVSGC